MNEIVIEIKDVAHTYRQGKQVAQALKGVSLELRKNEIFGLLGPNGAGKTTLLSCIEGLIQPSAGAIKIDNEPPQTGKRKLGVQLQKTALLDELTASELIELYAAMYEVYLNRAQIDELLARFGIGELRHKLVRRMSGGQQQRLSLAIAVAHKPPIVLLDEPTESLDPHARRAVWDVVRQLRQQGHTILLTSHQMEEAEALCDRVAILERGELVACDSPARLIKNLQANTVLKATIELPLAQVQTLPGVQSARYTGPNLEVETQQPQATLNALYGLATQAGKTVADVALRQPNLEDVYLRLTGRTINS
jgi:ABC-2 type transport system ATP-binding protein